MRFKSILECLVFVLKVLKFNNNPASAILSRFKLLFFPLGPLASFIADGGRLIQRKQLAWAALTLGAMSYVQFYSDNKVYL